MTARTLEQVGSTRTGLGFFGTISQISYQLFKVPSKYIARAMPSLTTDLLKSNVRLTSEGLVSVALFATLISGIVTIGVVGTGMLLLSSRLFLLASPVPLVVFLLVLNGPKLSQSSRSSALNNELPFVVGYMSILAGGGLSLTESLRRISDLTIFKAAASEAKRILIDIDVMGYDPLSALDRAAKYSPSKPFADLLSGYTTVLRTGGDYVNYLQLHLKESFEEMGDRVKRTVDTTALVAESYLIVTVVLGVTLFTLYLVQTLVDQNPAGITSIYFFSYIIVPILSAGFVWLLDAVQPKWPFSDYRVYRFFLASIPAGVIIFLIPLPIQLYLRVSIALIAVSIAPSYFSMKYSRERRAIEKTLPDFIKDVAEGRKIGLPPEESIERLGESRYGALSKFVQKMAAQLSWGVPLGTVIATFASAVHSWIARAIGTLMLEVVEVGGGTIKGFAEMAEFTRRISNIETESRSTLRHYVLIAYIGGMMLIMTTFMMILLLSQSTKTGLYAGASHLLSTPPGTVDALITAGIFECWVVGLVAGKMGEGAVTEGFKHSVALVVINLIAVVIGGYFIKIPF